MAHNKFETCSQALVMVGGRAITSFNGNSADVVAAATLYEPAVRTLLGGYRWRFSSIEYQLTRLATAPLGVNFTAAYQLPPDALNIHTVEILGDAIKWDRYEDRIVCNAETSDVVIADVTYRSSESYWPPYFESTLQLLLAAQFAIPVAEDAQKATTYFNMHADQLRRAKAMDAQSRTATKVNGVGSLRRYAQGRP